MGNPTGSWEFFLFLSLLIYLPALGLCCCTQAFSSCSNQGLLFLGVLRLLIAMTSLVEEITGPTARGVTSCFAQV